MIAILGAFFSVPVSADASECSSWLGPWLSCQPKKARNMSRRSSDGGILSDRISMMAKLLVACFVCRLEDGGGGLPWHLLGYEDMQAISTW